MEFKGFLFKEIFIKFGKKEELVKDLLIKFDKIGKKEELVKVLVSLLGKVVFIRRFKRDCLELMEIDDMIFICFGIFKVVEVLVKGVV